MSDGIYLDNDVILKVCTYGAADELVRLTTCEDLPPAILALARFTMRGLVERSKKIGNKDRAKQALDCLLAQARALEPTPQEVEHAAELEQRASEANMSFDSGESQIVAMLLNRGGLAFLTGDKRAARAMAQVAPDINHRLASLEQVMCAILNTFGLEPLRSSVCSERIADIAVTNCFQCSAAAIDPRSITEGLRSYTNSLRGETGDLLIASDDLSGAVVP